MAPARKSPLRRRTSGQRSRRRSLPRPRPEPNRPRVTREFLASHRRVLRSFPGFVFVCLADKISWQGLMGGKVPGQPRDPLAQDSTQPPALPHECDGGVLKLSGRYKAPAGAKSTGSARTLGRVVGSFSGETCACMVRVALCMFRESHVLACPHFHSGRSLRETVVQVPLPSRPFFLPAFGPPCRY